MQIRFVPQMAAVLSAALLAMPAAAAVYDVDATASSLTVTGNFAGIPAAAQTGESNTFFLDGTLVADAGPTAISFAGGSLLDGLPFGSDLRPGPGGADSGAPADFGLGGTGPVFAEAAGRDFTFDLLDGTTGPAALAGGAFAASGLNLRVLSGMLDYRVVIGSAYPGSRNLTNSTAVNAGGVGLLTVAGNVETLTLPVTATYSFEENGIIADVFVEGQIVATRLIPEPTSAAVLGLGGLVLAGRRRRR